MPQAEGGVWVRDTLHLLRKKASQVCRIKDPWSGSMQGENEEAQAGAILPGNCVADSALLRVQIP